MNIIQRSFHLQGVVNLMGDKSLSHRAVIMASLSQGCSTLTNFLYAEDTLCMLNAFSQLGVCYILHEADKRVEIESPGLSLFTIPEKTITINVGNSGTAARLLLGLFAGIPGLDIVISGDQSLSKRPMKRITGILQKQGANFSNVDTLPIRVKGTKLNNLYLKEELGSAQVKSAFIFAGIASQTNVTIQEIKPSRNHTENMLLDAGVNLTLQTDTVQQTKSICLSPPYRIYARDWHIWNDISSAAFFIVATMHIPDSSLVVSDVLSNPFRSQYIDVLIQMGANIARQHKNKQCGENGETFEVCYTINLHNIELNQNMISAVIDEIPILAVASMFSEGTFLVRGAKELRYKESDRIHALCTNMINLGYTVQEWEDGFSIQGRPSHVPEGQIEGFQDHRIIMGFEIANIISKAHANLGFNAPDKIYVSKEERAWVKTSFPTFYKALTALQVEGKN